MERNTIRRLREGVFADKHLGTGGLCLAEALQAFDDLLVFRSKVRSTRAALGRALETEETPENAPLLGIVRKVKRALDECPVD